jgi:hypothetical protein
MTQMGQVNADPSGTEPPPAAGQLRVAYDGGVYAASPVARGAAYELFTDRPEPGFLRNPRPGARLPYRRFVPSGDIHVVEGAAPSPADQPLRVPLSRSINWDTVHRLAQTPRAADDRRLTATRHSIQIRRGTRMAKVLSAAQLHGYLHGWLPHGFCYREFDIAHLRTPAELAFLRDDGEDGAPGADEVVFMLRWKAVDPMDYEIPDTAEFHGLIRIPARDRRGPQVLGTGFAPSGQHLIPEYVTGHFGDLPLSAFAELVAYTADGTEVVLYQYLPEHRAWSRMVGPQWRHLFAYVPGVAADQEYFPVGQPLTRLVGWHRGQEFEALADPPDDFRVLARTRAARYPVESLARRAPYVRWRGITCTVILEDQGWLRVRLVRPDTDAVAQLGAACRERGVYEAWAPLAETTARQQVEIWYDLGRAAARATAA